MEIEKQRNLHEDQMSDVLSFGSNYQRGSQSRKMSIGIAPASSANNITGKRYNPKRKKGSPWISPKPLVRSKTLGESFDTAKKPTNVTAVDGTCSNLKGVKEATEGTSLQSGNGKQKKVDTVVPGKESIKDVSDTPERGKGSRDYPKQQKGSPRISSKPPMRSKTLGESFDTAKKVTYVTAVDGTCSNLEGVKEQPTAGTSLQSGDGKQKKVDTVLHVKESIKDVSDTPARGNKLTQEAVKEIRVPNDGAKQQKPMENRSKDSLKVKLWEVLRTAPPINKELDGSGSVEVDADVMMQKDGKKEDVSLKPRVNGSGSVEVDANVMMQKDGKKEYVSLKPRVNSDTIIETDSENPEVAVSRPVTRSLNRKRGPAAARPKRLRKKLLPASEEKNVFSFEEKGYQGQYASTGRHLQCKTNSTGKKNLNIRRSETSDHPPRMSNTQKAFSGSKRPPNAEEISLRSGMGIAHGYQDQGRKKQAVRENSQSSPEANDSGQLGEGDNLISPVNGGKKDRLNCESAPKIANLINDVFGPVNKMKTYAPLPKPSAQAKEIENQNYTRLLGRKIIFVKDAPRSKSTQTAKQINLGSHFRRESSNHPAEIDDTVQSMREKHDAELFTPGRRKFDKTEEELSLSISNGSGEDLDVSPGKRSEFSPILRSPNVSGAYKDTTAIVSGAYKDTTPRTVHFEKQMPYKSKNVDAPPRFNYSSPPFCFPNEVPAVEVNHAEKHIFSPGHHEAFNFNDLNPTFCSPNATRLSNPSQEYQEDGLERAVALFQSALENFKNNLVSSTKKRSSEVLESTAEEINSKFESAKSQIEKDVTKLTNGSRSKSKILEKSFNEEQEQLQLIHKKFKDEIRRHIEAHTRTVENLEANVNDLKGVIERRKASHQKLIMQVEEAVEKCLRDAQRKLMSIQKEGRSKMQHLKTAVSECVDDGIFS